MNPSASPFPLVRRALLGAGLALAAALAACAAPQQNLRMRIVSTEHYAPTQLVQVLQAMPAREHVVLAEYDASAPAGTSSAQLLAQLQASAAHLGADALVVHDLSTRSAATLQFNPSGGQFEQSAGEEIPHLRATAIRYTTKQP
jgi:hypothetical protein